MTLQKKLDDLGDRLKRNHEGYQPTDKLDTSNPPNHVKDPYDLYIKGKLFDALKKEHEALKKSNVELVEALRIVKDYIEYPYAQRGTTRIRKAVEKALKNNNND